MRIANTGHGVTQMTNCKASLEVTYVQTLDGELTERFHVQSSDGRLAVTGYRKGYDSFSLLTYDADMDEGERQVAPVKFTFREALAQAFIFCGMIPEVNR
jgi:hypothetical protein